MTTWNVREDRISSGSVFQIANTSVLPSLSSCCGLLSAISVVAVAVAVAIIGTLRKRKRGKHVFEGIPWVVPNPHWFWGHLRCLGSSVVEGQRQLAVDHAGGPKGVSTFWIANQPCVSVLDGREMSRILKSTSERRGSRHQVRHWTRLLGKSSILLQNGPAWKRNRGWVHKTLAAMDVRMLQQSITSASHRFEQAVILTIQKHQQKNHQQPLSLDGITLARMASLDVFGLSAFGYDFGCSSTDPDAEQYLHQPDVFRQTTFLQMEFVRRCFQQPFNLAAQCYWWPFSRLNQRHKYESQQLREKLLGILIQRRQWKQQQQQEKEESTNATKPTFLVDSMLNNSDQHGMDDETLADWLVTLLFGGYDTTSIGLASTLYFLAKYPRYQQYCAEEAQQVLCDDDFDATHDLPMITACILEALRLYPPATITARNLDRPYELKLDDDDEDEKRSVTLPIHTRIVCPFYWIHRDERNFPRPSEYLPERWVQKKRIEPTNNTTVQETQGTAATTKTTQNESSWMERTATTTTTAADDDSDDTTEAQDVVVVPMGNRSVLLAFSAGGRNCVGQNLALRMLPTIVSFLLRTVQVDLKDPEYAVQLVRYGGNAVPRDGVPLTFSLRRPSSSSSHDQN